MSELPRSETAMSRYDALRVHRDQYVTFAEEQAKITIPSLFPETGTEGNTNRSRNPLPSPWNSVGARGVNHLSSQLIFTLVPPNTPFFNIDIDDDLLSDLASQNPEAIDQIKTELSTSFAEIERIIVRSLESESFRTAFFEAIRQLLVAGNVLLQLPASGGIRLHRLDNYVVNRDVSGNPIEIVVREQTTVASLPDDIREQTIAALKTKRHTDNVKPNTQVDVYTWSRLNNDGMWEVHQEVENTIIDETEGTYRPDAPMFLPLRFIQVTGENYGRGFCEQYIGDLRQLDALTRFISLGAFEAAKVHKLVRPGSLVKLQDLMKDTGHVGYGEQGDVSLVRADKGSDLAVAAEFADRVEKRLEAVFLLHSARNAERVTAEEIRMQARMLETALGGVYSVLSQEFQRPLVRRVIKVLTDKGAIPQLPVEHINLRIVTGVEALGRGHEQDKVDAAISRAVQMLGPEAMTYLNPQEYLKATFTNLGVSDKFLRSEEEVQQLQQARQAQQMAESLGPEALRQAGQMVQQEQQPEASA